MKPRFKCMIVVFLFFPTLIFSQNWSIIESGERGLFRSLYFLNSDTGYAVAEGIPYDIYKTMDSGHTWEPYPAYCSSGLHSVVFVNPDSGIAVGGGGGGDAVIRKTYDAGAHWDTFYPFEYNLYGDDALFSISCPSENIGYAAGKLGLHSVILKTEDCGQSWKKCPISFDYYFTSVYFITDELGFAVGYGGIIVKTNDGGDFWEVQTYDNEPELNFICFVDSLTGFIGGANGTILKSDDCGHSWSQVELVYDYDITSICFMDSTTGYATGHDKKYKGIVLKTNDRGEHWELQAQKFEHGLFSVCFPIPFVGFVCGSDILIAKTNFPPIISTTVPDVSFEDDSGTHLVISNLYDIFSDIDSPCLHFTASVIGEGLTATVDDSSLYISTVKDSFGIYPVVITATDDYPQAVSDTFNVKIIPINDISKKYKLYQNHPNPFTTITTISFKVPIYSKVDILFYNLLGEEIRKLYSGYTPAGIHNIKIDGSDIPSGIYFYQLKADNCRLEKRCNVIK